MHMFQLLKQIKELIFLEKKKLKKFKVEWDKKYKSKIKYVVGDEWYGGNLSYHLKSRPKWISINDKKAYELLKSKDRMNGAMNLENIYPAINYDRK